MTPLVRSATRAAAVVTYMTVSMVFVLSTAYVVRPEPGASPATFTLTILLFLALVMGLVSLDMRVTRDLGFHEPDWVLIPRFALMSASVLMSGRVDPDPVLRAVAVVAVVLAVVRGVFQVGVLLNRRIVGDAPDGLPEGDVEVVELPETLVSLLVALDPLVEGYRAGLALVFGDPEEA